MAKTKMVAKRISKRITSETPQQPVVIPNVTKTASETPQTSVVVQVTNNWTFLTSCSPSLLEKLQTSLSFPRKVYRPPSYRGPHVPPTVVGFITKKGRFGTGLFLHLYLLFSFFICLLLFSLASICFRSLPSCLQHLIFLNRIVTYCPEHVGC